MEYTMLNERKTKGEIYNKSPNHSQTHKNKNPMRSNNWANRKGMEISRKNWVK